MAGREAGSALPAVGFRIGLLIAVGVPDIGSLTGVLTILQRAAPERARGRVLSGLFAVLGGVQAAGMLVAGLRVRPRPRRHGGN